MSVTDLDPIFGVLHADGAAATPAEPEPPTPVSEPAAIATDSGVDGIAPLAPELEQPAHAAQHEPDLLPADLEHDPLTDEDENLGGFDAVTDGAPDFDDDEPVATVEVDYGDELEPLEIAAPAAPPISAAPAPATAGVFAAFTPPIPQPSPSATEASPGTSRQSPGNEPRHAAALNLRLPRLGALQPQLSRLLPASRRQKKRTIIALVLLALVVVAAAMAPGKTSPPKPGTTSAAHPAATATALGKRAPHETPEAAHHRTHAASPQPRRPRVRVRTRVPVRRVTAPAAPAVAPGVATVRRATPGPRASATAAASEFRP